MERAESIEKNNTGIQEIPLLEEGDMKLLKRELAEKLGISRMTLYRWEKTGRLEELYVKQGAENDREESAQGGGKEKMPKGNREQGATEKKEVRKETAKGESPLKRENLSKKGTGEKRKQAKKGLHNQSEPFLFAGNPEPGKVLFYPAETSERVSNAEEEPTDNWDDMPQMNETDNQIPDDALVEKALYQRATGYVYEEVTKELIDGELQVKKVVQKQVAPDISAQIYWLKNRQPDRWRDKQEEREEQQAKVVVYYDYGEG